MSHAFVSQVRNLRFAFFLLSVNALCEVNAFQYHFNRFGLLNSRSLSSKNDDWHKNFELFTSSIKTELGDNDEPVLKQNILEQQWKDKWNSKYVTIQGVRIHYKDTGPPSGNREGQYKTVVMLHGFAGSTACWDDVFPTLAGNFRVIAFDRPAFGLTERPTVPMNMPWDLNVKTLGEDPYTVDFSVKLVWRLLDRLRVPSAVLVGHSLGCQVAMRAAQARPRRAEGVVLIAPAILNAFDEIAGNTGGGIVGSLQNLRETAQTVWGYARFIGAVNVPRLGLQQVRDSILSGPDMYERVGRNFYNPQKVTQQMVDKYQRPLEEENWDLGLVYFYRASQGDWEPGAQFLDKVKQVWNGPALVIAGDHDGTCLPEACEKVSNIIDCDYKLVEKSGHNIPDEHPDLIAQEVRAFLLDKVTK